MTHLGLQRVMCPRDMQKKLYGAELKKHFEVVWYDDEFSQNQEEYNIVEGILCFPTVLKLITDHLLSMLPNLKVVSIFGSGMNGLDISKLHRLNIRAANIPHATAESTADIAFTLLLASARRLKETMVFNPDAVNEHIHPFMGTDVTGATLGILGMGNVGYCVAQRATGFRMKTLYYNRTRRSQEDEERVNATYCSTMDELLKVSDFLVISVPLTSETDQLIGQRELALMKSNSILINVGRGRSVDTDALVHALRKGKLSAVGLDVTEPEPLPHDHPLLQMKNVIVSGHIGTATTQCHKRMLQAAIDNLKAGMTGGVLNNELFPPSY